MDSKTLVAPDIDAGQRLREALDTEGFKFKGLLWLYYPDAGEWRLVVLTPSVTERGPLSVYKRLSRILDKHHLAEGLPLRRMTVASPTDEEFRQMRKIVRVRGKQPGIRISDCVVNGSVIHDAYVYYL